MNDCTNGFGIFSRTWTLNGVEDHSKRANLLCVKWVLLHVTFRVCLCMSPSLSHLKNNYDKFTSTLQTQDIFVPVKISLMFLRFNILFISSPTATENIIRFYYMPFALCSFSCKCFLYVRLYFDTFGNSWINSRWLDHVFVMALSSIQVSLLVSISQNSLIHILVLRCRWNGRMMHFLQKHIQRRKKNEEHMLKREKWQTDLKHHQIHILIPMPIFIYRWHFLLLHIRIFFI